MAPLESWTLTSTNWQFHTNSRVCVCHTRSYPRPQRAVRHVDKIFRWNVAQWEMESEWTTEVFWRHCSNLNLNLNGNETMIQLAFCIQDCPCPSCFILTWAYKSAKTWITFKKIYIFYKLGRRELNHAATRAACTFQFHEIWSEENPRNAPRFQCWCGQIKGRRWGRKLGWVTGLSPFLQPEIKQIKQCIPLEREALPSSRLVGFCLSKDVLLSDRTGPTGPVRDPHAEPDSPSFGPLLDTL